MIRFLRAFPLAVYDEVVMLGAIAALATTAACDSSNPPAPQPPPLMVTSGELWILYQHRFGGAEAAEKARAVFDSSGLRLSGRIVSVDSDIPGYPILIITSSEDERPVHAELSPALRLKAGSLAKGQELVINCSGVADVAGSPMLRNCSF